nr:unnamed protein product [Callosobruchus analis]
MQNPLLFIGIKDFSNWPTIPQVFINGEFIVDVTSCYKCTSQEISLRNWKRLESKCTFGKGKTG